MKTIPNYSPCCQSPVLAHQQRIYCHGCDKTLIDLRGPRRKKALTELRWERWFDADNLSLVFRGQRVAYARDSPRYRWIGDRYVEISKSYKWVIDASIASQALCLAPDCKYGFQSLHEAASDLRRVLMRRGARIPRLQQAKV